MSFYHYLNALIILIICNYFKLSNNDYLQFNIFENLVLCDHFVYLRNRHFLYLRKPLELLFVNFCSDCF